MIKMSQCSLLPLSPPALVSVRRAGASSVRRSTQSGELHPETSVCTGPHLQKTRIVSL